MAAPPKYTDNPAPMKGYGTTPTENNAAEPLLAAQAGASRNAWMNQPSEDDVPDDFKIGVNVIDCDAEIRLAFVRKVYSILFVQLLLTSIISLGMSLPAAVAFNQEHPWVIYIPMVCSFASLFGVYWKRHQHPANLVLLGLFTVFEAMLIGTVTSYYESKIVNQPYMLILLSALMSSLGTSSTVHHCRCVCRSHSFHIPDQGGFRFEPLIRVSWSRCLLFRK